MKKGQDKEECQKAGNNPNALESRFMITHFVSLKCNDIVKKSDVKTEYVLQNYKNYFFLGQNTPVVKTNCMGQDYL